MWTVPKLPTLGPRPYASHGLHAQAETASLGQNKGWISDKNLHFVDPFPKKAMGVPHLSWFTLESLGFDFPMFSTSMNRCWFTLESLGFLRTNRMNLDEHLVKYLTIVIKGNPTPKDINSQAFTMIFSVGLAPFRHLRWMFFWGVLSQSLPSKMVSQLAQR